MGNYQRGKSKFIDARDGKDRRIRNFVGRLKIEGDVTPFSSYASAWLERKRATLARSTYGDYLSIWKRYVLPHFGNAPLCRVTGRDVDEFLGKLAGISAKRKNNILVPLKCLFNDATRRGDIEEPPTAYIRRFKETKPFADPFSFPEMNRFLTHVDPRYGAYFTTAFLTGMRPNEMIALKWIHVDFEMRCITIREGRVLGVEGPPKTMSSYRDIDMLEPLQEVLRRHRPASPRDSGHVFTNRNGNPLEVNNLRNRVWYPAIIIAGLRKRTMYQTRHTFASLMLSHGEDPLWVARMLGHTGLDMIFKHYGKFIRNRSRKDGGRFLEGLREAEAAPPGRLDIGYSGGIDQEP